MNRRCRRGLPVEPLFWWPDQFWGLTLYLIERAQPSGIDQFWGLTLYLIERAQPSAIDQFWGLTPELIERAGWRCWSSWLN